MTRTGTATGSRTRIVAASAAALLLGAAVVYAAGEIYTPNPEGDWIRDAGVYAPGSNDQINVLGDIQPGGGVLMLEVGLRLNSLARAGKKGNWDLADYEATELEEALDKLMITRPGWTTDLESFVTTSLDPVITAVAAQDKTAFKAAMGTMVSACTSCHALYGKSFLVVKTSKSAKPLDY